MLNNLYKQTQMESVFGINMVALVDGQPQLLNLKELLEAFLRHRREVVTRRTVFDLRKARERGHILEGLAVALANIDDDDRADQGLASPGGSQGRADRARTGAAGVVPEMLAAGGCDRRRVRTASTRSSACTAPSYRLSGTQAQAILDLRLHRLTGLEQDKILAEYGELLEHIRDLADILARPERLLAGDPRRSCCRFATSTATRAARASSATSPTSRSRT